MLNLGSPVKVRRGPATVLGRYLQGFSGLRLRFCQEIKPLSNDLGRRRKVDEPEPGDLPVLPHTVIHPRKMGRYGYDDIGRIFLSLILKATAKNSRLLKTQE